MNLLVTGGAGFIGSNFVRYMLARHSDCRIITLDKLTYAGSLANLDGLLRHRRHQFVKGDICDQRLVFRLAARIDAIVNFAAETHVDRSIREPAPFLQTNVVGTGVLLQAARHHRHERYLQISTDEVYGSIARGRTDETAPLHPGNPYSAAKAGGDLLVQASWMTYGLPAIISRCCNNYGPYQYPEKLLPLLMTNAQLGLPLPIYGDGLNRRDWLYVTDHCRAVDLLLRRGKPGSVYNVGGGEGLSNLAVAKRVVAALNSASKIQFVADRPGHDRRYALADEKIRALGWRPLMPFREGLPATIEWYRTHRTWWEKIRGGAFQHYYRRHYATRCAAVAGKR